MSEKRARCQGVGAGILAILIGACAACAPAAHTRAAPAPAQVTLFYTQATGTFTPVFIADDEGFFAGQALDVRFVTGSSSKAGVAALASGEAQVLAAGATEVGGYDAAGGDIVMLAAASDYPIFSLYTTTDIRSVADLVGKKIAVTALGTSSDSTARLILDHYNLTGKVQIIAGGGNQAALLAELERGLVAGAILAPPITARADRAGFVELVNGFRLGIPLNMNGIDVTRSYLRQHREIVTRFLRAYLAAWTFIRDPRHEAATVAAISRHLRIPADLADATYRAYLPVWSETAVPRLNLQAVAAALRYAVNPKVRQLEPASLVDNSVIDALVR